MVEKRSKRAQKPNMEKKRAFKKKEKMQWVEDGIKKEKMGA